MSVCGCWDQVVRLDLAVKSLADAIKMRKWKEARKDLPLVEKLIEELEKCSGIGLLGARSRLEMVKREMARYDWVRAWVDAESIMNEIIYDIGCRRFKIRR